MPSSIPLPREAIKLFKPGYAHLLNLLQNSLGLDPLTLVNTGLLLAGIFTFLRYLFTRVIVLWVTVRINDDDQLYDSLMRWMSDHQFMNRQFRSVKAISASKSTWEDEEEALKSMIRNGNKNILTEPDPNNLISYRTIVGRSPISLQPFQGTHLFRRHGSWILFQHLVKRGSELVPNVKETGYIQLKCLGSSFAPVRGLLEEAQLYHLERTKTTTTVHRAISNVRDMIRWTRFSARPSRDMSTVIFDKRAKQELLQDINEYLHPHTRRWYANHGIPYRRGYLFSGAPGTGKTSLTSALAGVFGLDIYVLSLLDPNMNESALMRLMSEVPSRCIVLLEDIDAAGLNRPASEPKPGHARRNKIGNTAESTAPSVTQGSVQGIQNGSAATSVSLSGLLNAIDGVSSQEGRILIMTTNSPESLDKALIRPGRVDMHIAFELPSKVDMQELFLSMYRDDTVSVIHGCEVNTNKEQDKTDNRHLESLAVRFADSIPERKFSLAALQGYLLQYKRSPEEACSKAAEWAEKKLAEDDE
ncbi:bcs1 AAA-type ATPase, putative [Talaromyces stipitatus ATCC 10500]|uniref:Bcs1 AAA-type ATPase, putative n=1 Tax=Talaromyces stipitatus (strain ATCC 10500 / CBS 375.48 / QM 6759 / NRRL 1006) TaxID=441959 RepID=B8MTK2_TALSN|nr:bcs1 AAA-type ATPase, putative [Talaromyces stipitatus ATCC 10500]EED12408.1 bcs1 AAA-type ATPase, putative [Talaromyces stipitatus ATCC 10500]